MPEAKHKIDGVGTYLFIYVLLLALLITTVSAAGVNMGPWNIVTALLIAVVKALLVILFSMHVRHSSRLTWIFAGAAFLWLTLLLGLTLSEYLFRPAPPLTQSTAQLGTAYAK
jgi:cytochrome c oxidase subunit 4